MKRFREKTVFITGAASGIGRGIAIRFAKEGADIAVCDISKDGAHETVEMIGEAGQKAIPVFCDVGREKEIELAVSETLTALGKIDILVNCAGIGDTNKSFEEIEPDLWDRIYGVNVRGPFFLSKAIAMDMIQKKIKGRIINISSTEGKTNRAGSIVYASSKQALIGLTQGLAIQLAPYDITVNAICPGLIDTPIWHRADKAMDIPAGSMVKMLVETSIQNRALKIARVGKPEDIAAAASFLSSEEAGYITGQALNVCGGMEFH